MTKRELLTLLAAFPDDMNICVTNDLWPDDLEIKALMQDLSYEQATIIIITE